MILLTTKGLLVTSLLSHSVFCNKDAAIKEQKVLRFAACFSDLQRFEWTPMMPKERTYTIHELSKGQEPGSSGCMKRGQARVDLLAEQIQELRLLNHILIQQTGYLRAIWLLPKCQILLHILADYVMSLHVPFI
jgi:hypothetical protein